MEILSLSEEVICGTVDTLQDYLSSPKQSGSIQFRSLILQPVKGSDLYYLTINRKTYDFYRHNM